jgi:urease accessory protein
MDPARVLGLLAQARTEAAVARLEPPSDPDNTPYVARTRLLTVTTVEAATAVVARAVSLAGSPLDEVVAAWSARTPNPVTRARSRAQGRALLKAAAAHLPKLRVEAIPHPVALGVVAAAAGLPADDLARLVGYDDVEAVLEGADTTDALVWRHALMDDIVAMASRIAHLVDPERIPATGAPMLVGASGQ